MTYIQVLGGIAVVFLLVCLSPGPSFVVISSTAISTSRRAGMLIGVGVAAATMTWATAVMLGLGLLLAQAAWLYNAIKLAGAAYLIYLGVRMILAAWRGQETMDVRPALPTTALRYVGKGYLVAVSNPTAAIFFGSVFSAMLPLTAPIWVYLASVGVVTAVSASWHCGVAVILSIRPIQAAYKNMKRGIDASAGTILVLLGVRLAASR